VLLAVFILAAVWPASAQAPRKAAPAAAPQEIVKQFYAWYLHRLNRNDYEPLKNRTMASKYLTPGFLRRVPRLQHELEADVIVCAQDTDPAWEKNFVVDPPTMRGASATVLLALSGNDPDTLKHKVTLKRTTAGWRINSVDCGE
jgi:hypothetical protein